ncbi:MAG: lipase family protein [Treponema sp.]|nr:lipase family protein [Treponema sp.]
MKIQAKVLLSSFFLFFLYSSPLFSKSLTFPVHGLEVKTEEAVPIDIDWDENWFYETPTTKYHHGIARIAALLSEISYVEVEKKPEDNEMLKTYQILGVKKSDIEFNYILDYTIPISGNNQAAYSFAYKNIQTPHGTKKLVFVVLRGTPLSANEWISNINVSDTTHKNLEVHEGFYNTVTNIHKALIYFLLKNKISPDEAFFLITGHSRGGALANLLGATLEKEGIITGERLFVYTFAAPNVTQSEKYRDPKYNFIWNIINAEDIVPSVPPNRNNWKWKKFGQTRVIVNYWNCDQDKYMGDYMPKMNEYFNKFLLRNYAPFKNGPFIQIQIARVLTGIYKNVENYYGTVFGLRNKAENILLKVFKPSEENNQGEEKENQTATINKDSTHNENLPLIMRIIQKNINANIDGGFEYVMNSFIDMHACETYLSWMLALNEDEVYSTKGSTEIKINGCYDCAVYTDNGKLLGRILDGSYQLFSIKSPFAGMPLPNSNIFGFPGNMDLNIVIYRASLLPSSVSYTIEHYDAAGNLIDTSDREYFFTRSGRAISFRAGEDTFSKNKIEITKLDRKMTKEVSYRFDLNQDLKFKIQPEFSVSTDKIINLGFSTGSQSLFFSILADLYLPDSAQAYGFSTGIGHQFSLTGRFYSDLSLFTHFIWLPDLTDDFMVNIIPAARLSISFKPRHRLQFVISGIFDVHIADVNDDAFTPDVRLKNLSSIEVSDKIEILPALQFGIRF